MKVGALAVVVIVLAVSAAPAAARDRCDRGGSRTVAFDRTAVLLQRGDDLYGCLRRSGLMRLLAENEDDDLTTRETWGNVLLSRRFASWTVERFGGFSCKAGCPEDFEPVTNTVHVRDLVTGSERVVAHAGPARRTVLTRTGGVAYLLGAAGDARLHALDAGGARLLDSGAIAAESVAVVGPLVRWHRDAAAQSALVAGGVTCQPNRGSTLAWNAVGRAYDRGSEAALYGCAWLRSRPALLTRAPHAHVAIGGRFVAWAEAGATAVHDLLTGRVVRPAAIGAVEDVAVGGDGALAWLEQRPDEGVRRLLATRGTSPAELAAGPIEPGSLVVAAGAVSWTEAGIRRSAPIG